MPRKPKPKAEPIEMPRTEKDLDDIMTGIEQHKAISNKIGELVNEGKITPEEIVEQSSINDARLYDLCDHIAIEREEDADKIKGDQELREGRRVR